MVVLVRCILLWGSRVAAACQGTLGVFVRPAGPHHVTTGHLRPELQLMHDHHAPQPDLSS